MPDINTDPLRIDCALAPQINFACHQNAVPLIRDLSITNPSSQDVTDLRLSMEASPGFITKSST
jgi:hypothetical protein